MAALVVNKLRGSLKVAAVKAPGLRGPPQGDAAGHRTNDRRNGDFGGSRPQARECVPRDARARQEGDDRQEKHHDRRRCRPEADIEARIAEIKIQLAETTSDYDREHLQERQARLAGGVAVIRVGGATEVEVREKKDRVDDAMNATRAAVEEGILPGGGVALLRASKALGKLKSDNDDQQAGIEIIRKAITWPARQIATNAGVDGSVVMGKILENDNKAYGYDAQSGEYGDLLSKGIIDPAKVVRTALQGAASVAGLLIMTEAMVAEVPGPPPPTLPGHDHDHHHDMDF